MDLKQKYSPTTIEDFIVPKSVKEKLLLWRGTRDFPNLIFYGPIGVGKSTLSKIFVTSILHTSTIGFEDYLFLNASEKTSIDNVRNELQRFTEFAPMDDNPFRVIILDEADNLSIKAQAALRGLMDESMNSCRFIFVCNSIERLQEAIISRCFPIYITSSSTNEFKRIIETINEKENLHKSQLEIDFLVSECYPDLRKVLNLLINTSEGLEKEDKTVRQILRVATKDPFVALKFLLRAKTRPTFSIDYFCQQIIKEIQTFFPEEELTNPRIFRILEALGTAYERYKNGYNIEVTFIYLLSLFKI